jgi:site-specific DNA recombinase
LDPNKTPFPSHSRVAAYLRDSGGEDQELSVPQQRDFVTRWCEENHLVLTSVFADEARPGSSTIGRTQFMAMISYFEDPACLDQGVLIWKYSRFSRDVDDSMYYRALLRIKGYIVHSLKDDVPNDDFGRLYESVIDFTNARFLKDMSVDVKRGLHHLLTTYGALPGTPPRGFMREPVEIGKRRDGSIHNASRWVPDPSLWEKCRQAWQMRAAGFSIKDIHKELYLFKDRTSYTAFFTNRLYLGELHYSDLVIENYAEALITKDIWDAVQQINQTNWVENDPHRHDYKNHPRRISSDFMLSGILFCARCGSLMVGKTIRGNDGVKFTYYLCSKSHQGMDCDAKHIPQETVEALVIMSLKDYILKPAVIERRSKRIAKESASAINGMVDEQRQLIQKVNDTKNRINNLVDRIANDPNAPQSILNKIKDFELELSRSQSNLDDLKKRKSSMTEKVITRDRAIELSIFISELMDSDDLDSKRAILKSIIKSVAVDRVDRKVRGIVTHWNPEDS